MTKTLGKLMHRISLIKTLEKNMASKPIKTIFEELSEMPRLLPAPINNVI
jgi:hypothetical protein